MIEDPTAIFQSKEHLVVLYMNHKGLALCWGTILMQKLLTDYLQKGNGIPEPVIQAQNMITS